MMGPGIKIMILVTKENAYINIRFTICINETALVAIGSFVIIEKA